MFFLIFSFFSFFIQTNDDDDDHGQEKKHLIDQGKYTLGVESQQQQQQRRRTISATNLLPNRSNNNAQENRPLIEQNPTNNLNAGDQPRRARSMLNETKCAPS